MSIDIFVPGIPQPKGSTTHFRGRITSANPQLKAWEDTIRGILFVNRCEMIQGAVTVELGFSLPQPPSRQPRPRSKDMMKRHPVPDVKPDLDKLVRGCLDALTGTVIVDDARVVGINTWKRSDLPVGVRVVVEPYPTMAP